MSRFSFGNIIDTHDADGLKDLLDHEMAEWEEYGTVGYDDPLETYFFNLDGSWIFGTSVGEIPTVARLQAVISACFKDALLPFNIKGLRELAGGIEVDPTFLSSEQAANQAATVSLSYMAEKIETAKFYRDQ